MSIYPVRLSEWFPFGDPMYETCYIITKISRCVACRSRLRFSKAVGHHSLPWGYGDIFCSWKCCQSGKIAKPDKRFERRWRRKYAKFNDTAINATGWLPKVDT